MNFFRTHASCFALVTGLSLFLAGPVYGVDELPEFSSIRSSGTLKAKEAEAFLHSVFIQINNLEFPLSRIQLLNVEAAAKTDLYAILEGQRSVMPLDVYLSAVSHLYQTFDKEWLLAFKVDVPMGPGFALQINKLMEMQAAMDRLIEKFNISLGLRLRHLHLTHQSGVARSIAQNIVNHQKVQGFKFLRHLNLEQVDFVFDILEGGLIETRAVLQSSFVSSTVDHLPFLFSAAHSFIHEVKLDHGSTPLRGRLALRALDLYTNASLGVSKERLAYFKDLTDPEKALLYDHLAEVMERTKPYLIKHHRRLVADAFSKCRASLSDIRARKEQSSENEIDQEIEDAS